MCEKVLSREKLKYKGGTILENVETIVQLYNSMMGLDNIGKSMASRYFWLIREPNIENLQDCCTLTGSSEKHSFRSSNAVSLAIHTKKIACFCSLFMHHYGINVNQKSGLTNGLVDPWIFLIHINSLQYYNSTRLKHQ